MQKVIQSGTCDHCLNENVPVVRLNQNAVKIDLCIKCLVNSANTLYREIEPSESKNTGEFRLSSMVSYNTKEPLVLIEGQALDHPIQMGIETARILHRALGTVIEAAIQDALLVNWMRDKGMDEKEQAMALYDFRMYRERYDHDN